MDTVKQVLSIRELIRTAWQLFKQRPWYLIGVMILPVAAMVVFQVVYSLLEYVFVLPFQGAPESVLNGTIGFLEVLRNILSWIVNSTVSLGVMAIYLGVVRNQPRKLKEVIPYARFIVPFAVASLLNGVVVFVGFLALIVPGVILAVSLQFFPYFLIDRQTGVIGSLQESWRATQGKRWKLFLLVLALAGLNILGAIPLGLGLFVTVPMTALVTASVYDRLVRP